MREAVTKGLQGGQRDGDGCGDVVCGGAGIGGLVVCDDGVGNLCCVVNFEVIDG